MTCVVALPPPDHCGGFSSPFYSATQTKYVWTEQARTTCEATHTLYEYVFCAIFWPQPAFRGGQWGGQDLAGEDYRRGPLRRDLMGFHMCLLRVALISLHYLSLLFACSFSRIQETIQRQRTADSFWTLKRARLCVNRFHDPFAHNQHTETSWIIHLLIYFISYPQKVEYPIHTRVFEGALLISSKSVQMRLLWLFARICYISGCLPICPFSMKPSRRLPGSGTNFHMLDVLQYIDLDQIGAFSRRHSLF